MSIDVRKKIKRKTRCWKCPKTRTNKKNTDPTYTTTRHAFHRHLQDVEKFLASLLKRDHCKADHCVRNSFSSNDDKKMRCFSLSSHVNLSRRRDSLLIQNVYTEQKKKLWYGRYWDKQTCDWLFYLLTKAIAENRVEYWLKIKDFSSLTCLFLCHEHWHAEARLYQLRTGDHFNLSILHCTIHQATTRHCWWPRSKIL